MKREHTIDILRLFEQNRADVLRLKRGGIVKRVHTQNAGPLAVDAVVADFNGRYPAGVRHAPFIPKTAGDRDQSQKGDGGRHRGAGRQSPDKRFKAAVQHSLQYQISEKAGDCGPHHRVWSGALRVLHKIGEQSGHTAADGHAEQLDDELEHAAGSSRFGDFRAAHTVEPAGRQQDERADGEPDQ